MKLSLPNRTLILELPNKTLKLTGSFTYIGLGAGDGFLTPDTYINATWLRTISHEFKEVV